MSKLRLDYQNFEVFKKEIDSGEIFQKTISPVFLVFFSEESKWCIVNKESDGPGYKFLSWFPEDISVIASLSSQISSLLASFTQREINQKFMDYLKITNRDMSFFSKDGNCNGYSFLHNIYTERGMEDYFFISLALILYWDGSEAGLSKAISPQLPQSKYYSTLGELFEQWLNDLALSMDTESVSSLFSPELKQNHRAIQYGLFKPSSEKNNESIEIVYSMKEDKPNFSNSIIFTKKNNSKFHGIARAKSQFLPLYLMQGHPVNSISMKNNKGNFIEVEPVELRFNNEPVLEVKDIHGEYHLLDKRELNNMIQSFQSSPNVKMDMSGREFITKARMLEQLKYLTRLPAGVYIDVNKSRHSTTFRMLQDRQIIFYDSNDSSPPSAFNGYEKLYQLILEKNGDYSRQYDSTENNENVQMPYTDMQLDQFQSTVYHFNSPRVRQALRDFSLFTADELPENIEQAKDFQQNSTNAYTHLHLAVMYRDFKTVRYLLENNLWDINAKDVYGCTALSLAIRSGNIKAALMILDASNERQYINSDFIEQAFSQGHHKGMMELLNHSASIVNLDSFTQSAMKYQHLDIISKLLEDKKINPDDYIQQALLSNDISLVELLVEYGANINIKDEFGNTALHYSAYMFNDACFFYLVNQPKIILDQKNSDQLSALDVAKNQLEHVKLSDDMAASLHRMVRYYEGAPASSSKPN